jgi:hypothetical protein
MKRRSRFGADFNSIAGGAYSGAADIGKGFAYLYAVIFIIISIALLIYGISIRNQPDVFTENVQFTVTSVTKTQIGNNNGTAVYDYYLTGTVPTCGDVTVTSYPYPVSAGQILKDIYMKPNCGSVEGVRNPISNKTMSNGVIGVAFILILFSLINVFFVSKFKGVAAVQGAGNILSLFRR